MSFDMGPIRNLSNVQASAKSSDGGAGNTGYFMRGEGDEEIIGFKKDDVGDSFKKQGEEETQESSLLELFLNFLSGIMDAVKNFFSNIFIKK